MASIEPAVFNSPHFTWQDPYLYINTTDSDGSQEPPEDTETSVSLFSGDPKCDQKIKMWKDKLGQTLVEDLLAIPLGQKVKKKYYLAQFPRGYVFYVRKTQKEGTQKKERYDGYLLGGGHTFRSPSEFVMHAAWLMAGAEEGRCHCIYCDPADGGQKERTEELKSNRSKVQHLIRKARATGTIISREPNAMNRKAFLKNTGTRDKRPKRASLEIHYANASDGGASTSSSNGGNHVKLVHGYDEAAEAEMEE